MGKSRVCPHCGKVYYRQDRFDKHVAKCKAKLLDKPKQNVITEMLDRLTLLETQMKNLMKRMEVQENPPSPPVPNKLVSDIELINLDLFELFPKMDMNGGKSLGRGKINKLCGNDPRRLPHAIFEWCLGKFPLFVNLGEQNKMVHASMKSFKKELSLKEYDTMENLVKVFFNYTRKIFDRYCTVKRCPQTQCLMIGHNEDFYPSCVYHGWRLSDTKNASNRLKVYMRDNKVLIEATYAAFLKTNIKEFTKTLQNHLRNHKKKVLAL